MRRKGTVLRDRYDVIPKWGTELQGFGSRFDGLGLEQVRSACRVVGIRQQYLGMCDRKL
jgi:hypothetical protein